MLNEMTAETVADQHEANDFLQELERAIDGDHERFVRARRSDDFEERVLGGDTLRLFEERERHGVNVPDNFFSTFECFVCLKFQDMVCFGDNLSQCMIDCDSGF